jgi:hypothetical protein
MADVKTKQCDVPECVEQGPDVLTLHLRAQRLKAQLDLCREHRRPVVETVASAGVSWSGRTAADAMALAAGQSPVDL